jgi:hypothetical protein
MAALNKGSENLVWWQWQQKALQNQENIEQFSYAKTLTQFQLFADAVFNKRANTKPCNGQKQLQTRRSFQQQLFACWASVM